ncbi:hypothetical protein L195_g010383 [Trifolium pratense]|uniref:Uncharacterized protein n=1 Tax=Trifolium pratense TaxID=57577 RepID=A0A2K3PEK5_TRIPR|nr:hypothetical protein L195_g010383 [Trifolium pratense]
MIVSGLSGTLSRCPQLPPPRCLESRRGRVMAFSVAGKSIQGTAFPRVERRQVQLVKSAMDASFGDNDSAAVFPRINVNDPYKRLGISKEASEEEIQGARNFLIQKYAGHKPSVDSIESAHDKIIMQKFYERPTLQVAISLFATTYFVYDRLKSKIRAVLYGYGWSIYLFMAVGNLLDGVSNSSYSFNQGTKGI